MVKYYISSCFTNPQIDFIPLLSVKVSHLQIKCICQYFNSSVSMREQNFLEHFYLRFCVSLCVQSTTEWSPCTWHPVMVLTTYTATMVFFFFFFLLGGGGVDIIPASSPSQNWFLLELQKSTTANSNTTKELCIKQLFFFFCRRVTMWVV